MTVQVRGSPAGEDKRLKVAQILYSGLGGHADVAFGIADGDTQSRWRNAFAFVGIEPLVQAYARRAASSDIEYGYVVATAGRPWRAWRPLARWLQATAPSAILLHSPTLLWPCWRHARKRGIPLMVVEHQANHLKTRHDWLYSHLSMRLADKVVVLSEDYRALMEKHLGRSHRPEAVSVIPNGIDVSAFSGAKPFAANRPVRIGMAARFTSIKLFALLIEAASRLHEADRGLAFTLSLAGSGETLEEAKRAAQISCIAGRVTFEGPLFDEALAAWYRGLDIYCHLSVGETLPMSIIKAMSAGLPVIGSKVSGIDNLLGHEGAFGLLVDNEPGAIAEAMMRLVGDADHAQSLGAAGRAKAMAQFSNVRTFERYDAAIRDTVRRS